MSARTRSSQAKRPTPSATRSAAAQPTVPAKSGTREHMARRPVSVAHERPPRDRDLDWVLLVLGRLPDGFMDTLASRCGDTRGRPSSYTARHVLIAWLLLATKEGHHAEITDAVGQLVAMNPRQRTLIDLPDVPRQRAYKRFCDKFERIRACLEEGFDLNLPDDTSVRVDLDWFVNAIPRAAIPPDLLTSTTRAVDGTDWESAGRFRPIKPTPPRSRKSGPLYDGDAVSDTDTDPDEHAKEIVRIRTRTTKSGVWEVGHDGRAIYTTDRDARAGYRTATSGRAGGLYIGSELHLVVQVSDFSYQGDVTRVSEGAEVPKFVTSAALSPSGTHRGRAVMPAIMSECAWTRITCLAWDRGYSILGFDAAHGALRALDIEPVFDLTDKQRDYQPVSTGVVWRDGTPFHSAIPKRLLKLERPPMGASSAERANYQKLFNERAHYAFVRHAGPDSDGVTRWKCPFCAGKLRDRQLQQRKVNKSALIVTTAKSKLVKTKDGTLTCCDGTLTLTAEHLNLMQAFAIPYGTTAHAQAYGRRQGVETVNSYLNGAYIRLDRTYSRLMNHRNRKFVLAIMLAGLNRYIENSWRERLENQRLAAAAPKTRARRRTKTLADLISTEKPTEKPAESGRRPSTPRKRTTRPATKPAGSTAGRKPTSTPSRT